MRTLSVIFAGIGCYFLLRVLDFSFQIIPLHPTGHEGVVVEAIVSPLLGAGASLLAVLFAFIDRLRTPRSKFWHVMVVWCGLQIFGLIGVVIYG